MHVLRKFAAMAMLPAALALAMSGCGGDDDEQPPLDEMTLRDVLLADPEVVAHLQKDARDRLRTRFGEQRVAADAVTEVTVSSELPILNQVVTMDAARFRAGRDALITGAWQVTNSGAEALPFSAVVGTQPKAPLPALGGDISGSTLLSAEHALEGQAGAIVEALMAMTGAKKVERVVAWPIAALATMDTVYVNASWLVAMDESGTGCGSGGGSGSGKNTPSGPPQNGLYNYLITGDGSGQNGTAGAGGEGTDSDDVGTIQGQNKASGADFCSSSSSSCSNSCSSASDGCSNSASACSSSADSCSNSTKGCSNSSSSCSNSEDCDPTGDKECCRSCSMGGRSTNVVPQSPIMAFASMFWLLAPLGFLLMRENSPGAKLRQLHLRLLSSVTAS